MAKPGTPCIFMYVIQMPVQKLLSGQVVNCVLGGYSHFPDTRRILSRWLLWEKQSRKRVCFRLAAQIQECHPEALLGRAQ